MSSATASSRSALIQFPGAPYTQKCALNAARKVLQPKGWKVIDGCSSEHRNARSEEDVRDANADASHTDAGVDDVNHSLYFTDYDLLPFEQLLDSKHQQCSSYVIRKALIRKHYLAHSIHAHSLKLGSQSISSHLPLTPRTWFFELQFADDLDELLVDELYDLRELMEAPRELDSEQQWYILKPGMADRGNGIRLFRDEQGLRSILEELEGNSDEETSESGSGENDTGGMLGQLRHFVVQVREGAWRRKRGPDAHDLASLRTRMQEYIKRPLLLAPVHADVGGTLSELPLRKFHIRAYVICIGGLRVYLWDEMLALFAPLAFKAPMSDTDQGSGQPDPRVHLTNTCLHANGQPSADGRPAEENVFLLQDVIDCRANDRDSGPSIFTAEQHEGIRGLVAETIGRTFEAAAKAGSIHWQAWPNAWEIFGVDLLVGWDTEGASQRDALRVWLLEVNAVRDSRWGLDESSGIGATRRQLTSEFALFAFATAATRLRTKRRPAVLEH